MNELYLDSAPAYLNLELALKKERRPAYSLRAFARDLQMSPGSLVDFMKGRNGLSEARARKISETLKWSSERYDHFWDLIQARFATDRDAKSAAGAKAAARLKRAQARLANDSFQSIAQWQHWVILTYLQMIERGAETAAIADALSLGKRMTQLALSRLERLGLVAVREGRWIACVSSCLGGDESPSEAIRSFHKQILAKARDAIDEVEMEHRESLSLIYSMDSKYMPKIRREISQAVYRILTEYSERSSKNSKDDSIQLLTLQMFPVHPRPKRKPK